MKLQVSHSLCLKSVKTTHGSKVSGDKNATELNNENIVNIIKCTEASESNMNTNSYDANRKNIWGVN